ncbi:MAG: ABC transporter ATP-binding protein [Oscillospiraceae bacterium]
MLQIKNLTKIYKGGKKAVDNLSLTVEKGDIYGFIGHNGAGKSTTIKAIVGVMDFDNGEIIIDGMSIKTKPVDCKKIIAYIPDNPDLYDNLTGIQYLNFIGDVFSVNKAERGKDIEKYSEMFELTKNLGDLISSYSHGMKQKLALISAFIHKPKVLILDEPFVGLDPKASHLVKQFMQEFCANGGCIFFSTHVLDVAEKLCNKIAIIKNGRLMACGKTDELRGDNSLEDMFMELIDNEKSN